MNIETTTNEDKVVYYNFTQILKEFSDSKNMLNRVSMTNHKRKVPKMHFYFTENRGRNSKIYIDSTGLYMWLNMVRDINPVFKKKILNIINKKNNNFQKSKESFFINILCSFLKSMNKDIVLEKHKKIKNYMVDLCINNKLIIEFNEYEHKYKEDYDVIRVNELKELGYKVIIVSERDIYGHKISEIYKSLILI